MYPFYPGIDLHLNRTYMVLMNANGEVVDKQRISNQKITNYLQEKVPQETYAVLEATRWLCRAFWWCFPDKIKKRKRILNPWVSYRMKLVIYNP
ncbi:MAG: hypothetical protein MUO42_13005 [Anaerolineaceae bacterium]|nr:hypothetical protein [Anaerolineaceae bacterium]